MSRQDSTWNRGIEVRTIPKGSSTASGRFLQASLADCGLVRSTESMCAAFCMEHYSSHGSEVLESLAISKWRRET